MAHRCNYRSMLEHRRNESKRAKDRAGLAIIAAILLAFVGLFYGAFKLDQANGISVSQSLASAGIGGRLNNGRVVVRAESQDQAAELTGLIAAEMEKAGCDMRQDGKAEYTLESCK